ncbi:hypothetical protein LX32DRAFT_410621 [Colletotrichum zoysiae]|uniref:Uncharacterized protein n=1 Tax=Colletotrichum zoysiae TaxID=1216348 RepID=A0AAD9HFW1_9PEZI|nr:hypothetical protein LX32DRAFT_410621 [Colletotrichum zoysiae]
MRHLHHTANACGRPVATYSGEPTNQRLIQHEHAFATNPSDTNPSDENPSHMNPSETYVRSPSSASDVRPPSPPPCPASVVVVMILVRLCADSNMTRLTDRPYRLATYTPSLLFFYYPRLFLSPTIQSHCHNISSVHLSHRIHRPPLTPLRLRARCKHVHHEHGSNQFHSLHALPFQDP